MKAVRKRRIKLALLVFATLLLGLLAWPREDLALRWLGIDGSLKIQRGLDLQGGVSLTYEARLGELEDTDISKDEVVENAATVIERRVNPGGAGEAIVQTADGGRIIVQIPNISDPEQAKETIGKTAQLEFLEVKVGKDQTQQLVPTSINGQDVQKATVDFAATGGRPVVSLQLRGGESTEEFAGLTSRLAGTDTLLVAMLDGQIVFGPANVQNAITDGRAQLSGEFNVQQATEIADLLNAGALPVPIDPVAQQTIGPTLGEQSIKQSLVAAMVGLFSIGLFLVIYYRWAGLLSIGSLFFYSLALLSVIKLSDFTPYVIVLTLAGIAGFILSIAVAVDANVLIMERTKEETVAGNSPVAAINRGFEHAWSSIRDANVTTIIAASILYWFGAPLIKGFALTLGVGVAINLLTVQTSSKLLMRQLGQTRLTKKIGWIGLRVGIK